MQANLLLQNAGATCMGAPTLSRSAPESMCGRDESSAFPFIEASELVTDSKMSHLLYKTCDEAGKKPLLSEGA